MNGYFVLLFYSVSFFEDCTNQFSLYSDVNSNTVPPTSKVPDNKPVKAGVKKVAFYYSSSLNKRKKTQK